MSPSEWELEVVIEGFRTQKDALASGWRNWSSFHMPALAKRVPVSFFKGVPIFNGLEGRSLRSVLSTLKEETFPVGSLVFQVGDLGRKMYVIALQNICRILSRRLRTADSRLCDFLQVPRAKSSRRLRKRPQA